MAINRENYAKIARQIGGKQVTLVAVSKLRTIEEIMELYALGQRDFGENYVQELVEKHFILPHDIRWHFIGHLQSNKVKYIAPFIHLIHGVDSFKLLMEIDKQAAKLDRVVDCLLQVHIAKEETKFGLSEGEIDELLNDLRHTTGTGEMEHSKVCGLMGMASNTDDKLAIRKEFKELKFLYDKYSPVNLPNFHMETLSMGMSGDYEYALDEGTTMLRIGSLLFGPRPYQQKV